MGHEGRPPRVGIYCRLSEEDRGKQSAGDDSESIQNQKTMLLDYAAAQGWTVFDLYSDDDYAGSDRTRPAFNRLLHDAEQRKFDVVLCKTQSRFTRELELVETYIHGLFPLWGIRFVSIVDHADTANRGNKKARQINGLVNEWYLEDMSENIRSVLNSKRENGLHIGAFALYGYRKDPERRGHLLVDPEAASVVHEIFSLYAAGYGKTAIARRLNDRGVPNPSSYKRLHGLRYRPPAAKRSTIWTVPTISKLLENEMYIGTLVQGRYGSVSYKMRQNRARPRAQWYRVPHMHEPIIPPDLWAQVQARRAARARPEPASGLPGLFAQKTRCASCGHILRTTKTQGRTYLKCPTHALSPSDCPGAFVSADQLAQAVLQALTAHNAQSFDAAQFDALIQAQLRRSDPTQALQQELSALEARAAEAGACIRALYRDKATGLLSASDFLALSQDFAAEREKHTRAAADCRARLETMQNQPPPDLKAIREACMHPPHLTRPIIAQMIEMITVSKRVPGTHIIEISIHWRF